ncbi:uncharacterized [Tachysurus ichikawai]
MPWVQNAHGLVHDIILQQQRSVYISASSHFCFYPTGVNTLTDFTARQKSIHFLLFLLEVAGATDGEDTLDKKGSSIVRVLLRLWLNSEHLQPEALQLLCLNHLHRQQHRTDQGKIVRMLRDVDADASL